MTPLVSIILPCWHKAWDFFRAAEHSVIYSDSRVEVVLVLDGPEEEGLFRSYIRHNSSRIKFRLLVNDVPHTAWRPPCIAVNAGLRASLGKYVIVQSPESIVLFPKPDYLFQHLRGIENNEVSRFYMTGILRFINASVLRTGNFSTWFWQHFKRSEYSTGYGFLLAPRKEMMAIGGFDEGRVAYGHDDDCIRNRLNRSGCQLVQDDNVRVAHIGDFKPRRESNFEPLTQEIRLKQKPSSAFRVAYDWRK